MQDYPRLRQDSCSFPISYAPNFALLFQSPNPEHYKVKRFPFRPCATQISSFHISQLIQFSNKVLSSSLILLCIIKHSTPNKFSLSQILLHIAALPASYKSFLLQLVSYRSTLNLQHKAFPFQLVGHCIPLDLQQNCIFQKLLHICTFFRF